MVKSLSLPLHYTYLEIVGSNHDWQTKFLHKNQLLALKDGPLAHANFSSSLPSNTILTELPRQFLPTPPLFLLNLKQVLFVTYRSSNHSVLSHSHWPCLGLYFVGSDGSFLTFSINHNLGGSVYSQFYLFFSFQFFPSLSIVLIKNDNIPQHIFELHGYSDANTSLC